MIFPSSSDTKVVFGGTIRSNILTPQRGSSPVDLTYCNKTRCSGCGQSAVSVGDIRVEIHGFPGGFVFTQSSAMIMFEEKLEIVNTLKNSVR